MINCSLGLNVKREIVNLSKHNKIELPRFDTNNFPKNHFKISDISVFFLSFFKIPMHLIHITDI